MAVLNSGKTAINSSNTRRSFGKLVTRILFPRPLHLAQDVSRGAQGVGGGTAGGTCLDRETKVSEATWSLILVDKKIIFKNRVMI